MDVSFVDVFNAVESKTDEPVGRIVVDDFLAIGSFGKNFVVENEIGGPVAINRLACPSAVQAIGIDYMIVKRNEFTLKKFDELIECKKRIDYLKNDTESLKRDLSKMSNQVKVNREDFVPAEHFRLSFFKAMTENIKEIMRNCGDARYPAAEFDRTSFDISIRGQSKSANNGKGFRSFANSVTLMAFRKILDEKGKHQLPVYVIDSPLKNLDVGDLNKDNIKDGFFKYLIEASRSGQLIIIENTNNFTMTEELKEKANVIEFTHDENVGRYGFLLDYRD